MKLLSLILTRLLSALLVVCQITLAQAGVFEALSEGAYTVKTSGGCDAYDPSAARRALENAESNFQCSLNAASSPTQALQLKALASKAGGSDEDRLFALLAKQHARELSCAGGFADQVARGQAGLLEDLEPKLRALREARQAATDAASKLSKDPNVFDRTCPVLIEDLKPNPNFSAGQDIRYNLCLEAIENRARYNTLLASIPLANTEEVREMIDAYANSKTDLPSPELTAKLKSAFLGTRNQLNDQANKLVDTAEGIGGSAFDDAAKHSLLSDPFVNAKVVREGGDETLNGLVCEANARFGEGRDALEAGVLAGTFVLSAGVATAARAGTVAAQVARGATSARSAGFISSNASLVLRSSAVAVNGLAAYSTIDKSCFSGSDPSVLASASETCVAAPSVKNIEKDNCVLAASLTAIGAAGSLPRKELASLFKKLGAKKPMPTMQAEPREFSSGGSNYSTSNSVAFELEGLPDERLTTAERNMIRGAREKHGVRFFVDREVGRGSATKTEVRISPMAYRHRNSRGGTLAHEITHTTTSRDLDKIDRVHKVANIRNPSKVGRAIEFQTDDLGTVVSRMDPVYQSRARSDEVEARIKEIAFSRHENRAMPFNAEAKLNEANQFINEQKDIVADFVAHKNLISIEPIPGRYVSMFRVSHPKSKIYLNVPMPEDTMNQKAFVLEALRKRVEVLDGYSGRLKRYAGEIEANRIKMEEDFAKAMRDSGY